MPLLMATITFRLATRWMLELVLSPHWCYLHCLRIVKWYRCFVKVPTLATALDSCGNCFTLLDTCSRHVYTCRFIGFTTSGYWWRSQYKAATCSAVRWWMQTGWDAMSGSLGRHQFQHQTTQHFCTGTMQRNRQVAQLSQRNRTSYFDSQNWEVEFLSHPFGGKVPMLHVYVNGRSVVHFL